MEFGNSAIESKDFHAQPCRYSIINWLLHKLLMRIFRYICSKKISHKVLRFIIKYSWNARFARIPLVAWVNKQYVHAMSAKPSEIIFYGSILFYWTGNRTDTGRTYGDPRGSYLGGLFYEANQFSMQFLKSMLFLPVIWHTISLVPK